PRERLPSRSGAMLMTKRIVAFGVVIALAIVGLIVWWSVQPRASEPQPLESATTSSPEQKLERTDLVAADGAPERARMSAAPTSTPATVEVPKGTTLKVLAISKETRHPLSDVRLMLHPKNADPKHRWTDVQGSHGTIATIPISGTDGRVDFDAPPETPFMLTGRTEHGTAGYSSLDVAPLARGEMREIVLELTTADDSVFFGRVVD